MITAVKEWAYALFMTALAGGIASFISPDNPKMKKYVKLAVTVCAAAVMIMPLKNIVSKQFEFGAEETISAGGTVSQEYNADIAERKVGEILCDEINSRVYEQFGFYAEKIYFDGDTLVLEVENAAGVEEFVRAIYFGEVVILS